MTGVSGRVGPGAVGNLHTPTRHAGYREDLSRPLLGLNDRRPQRSSFVRRNDVYCTHASGTMDRGPEDFWKFASEADLSVRRGTFRESPRVIPISSVFYPGTPHPRPGRYRAAHRVNRSRPPTRRPHHNRTVNGTINGNNVPGLWSISHRPKSSSSSRVF